MKTSFAQVPLQKGQIVTNTCTGQSGIVTSVFYNEFSGQFVYSVRVPGIQGVVSWNEFRVTAAATSAALMIGDMVIAFDDEGCRHMGPIVGKTFNGELIVEFAIGTFQVSLDRVWRAWPMAQNMAKAS